MADECDHGAVAGGCHLCRGDQPAPRPRPEGSAIFVARFDTFCSGCDLPLRAGQAARYQHDRPHHAGCTDG